MEEIVVYERGFFMGRRGCQPTFTPALFAMTLENGVAEHDGMMAVRKRRVRRRREKSPL